MTANLLDPLNFKFILCKVQEHKSVSVTWEGSDIDAHKQGCTEALTYVRTYVQYVCMYVRASCTYVRTYIHMYICTLAVHTWVQGRGGSVQCTTHTCTNLSHPTQHHRGMRTRYSYINVCACTHLLKQTGCDGEMHGRASHAMPHH